MLPAVFCVRGRARRTSGIGAAKLPTKDEAWRIAATKSVSPNTAKHAFEPRTHWRKRCHRCGADVAWLHWRAGGLLGSYPLGRWLSLNSTNGAVRMIVVRPKCGNTPTRTR